MKPDSVLEIVGYGAWNGGSVVANNIYENKGMFFKGGKPVNNETIEERIGVRTRIVAPEGERIGVTALQDLLESSGIDSSRIKVVIGATNVGDDKYDAGPLVRHPFELIRNHCPHAILFDLYAGCPGFNVAAELVFMLSLTGGLNKGDISVVIAAENIHRAKAFKPLDNSNIIFGDDALATALETKASLKPKGKYFRVKKDIFASEANFVQEIAKTIFELTGYERIDGLIIDNQLGKLLYKVPAIASRIQHTLVELMNPRKALKGTYNNFKHALKFYDKKVNSFAFDIMTCDNEGRLVEKLTRAFVESGKSKAVVSVYLAPDFSAKVTLHKGEEYQFHRPKYGIVDALTRTHGCFADYIQAFVENDDVFIEIDGKGVFLHATRSARAHFSELLSGNNMVLEDIDLLIEHQANFAMIPMTIEKLLDGSKREKKKAVVDFLANRMITNIHERGNCSVVCMLRLPYDLERNVLKEDIIQGYPVNRNLGELKSAEIVMSDSVGAGMTRSSILQRKRVKL